MPAEQPPEYDPTCQEDLDPASGDSRLPAPLAAPAVLVVGGGIAGLQVALTVAEAGCTVYLVEREPSIGGHLAQLDVIAPTFDSAARLLDPLLAGVASHPNIRLMTCAEVQQVSGSVGRFVVRVRVNPRYVDGARCTACGLCARACVLEAGVPNTFDAGLSRRRAIYLPMNGRGIPSVAVIDPAACLLLSTGDCLKKCVDACPTAAVDLGQQPRLVDLVVGAVVLASGLDTFDAAHLSAFGFGRSPDILDTIQFERLSSVTGPTGGEIVTSRGLSPRRAAIIHCVGSRDRNAHPYCSRVCCMTALKHAHRLRARTGAEVWEFYIDIRTGGKGSEEFYEYVQQQGVYFVRGRAAEVLVLDSGQIQVRAEDTTLALPVQIDVDMVVLAAALEPRSDAERLASLFGLSRDADGFFLEADPVLRTCHTSVPGVFLAGACQSPRDLPDTVTHATAAAAQVLALIAPGRAAIMPPAD